MGRTLRRWFQYNGFLLAACLVLRFAPRRAMGEVYKVDGLQIEVTLVLEQPEMMLSEPVYLAFVIHNPSNEDLWTKVGGDDFNKLHRPSSFTVKLTGADGKPVPQPDSGDEVGGNSMMGPQKIPAHGSYAFRLLVSDWATLTEPGAYTAEVHKFLTFGNWDNLSRWSTVYSHVLVRLNTSVKVVPRDAVKIGRVIDKLGNAMLHGPYSLAFDAARTLAYIDDTRVVPYFVQAANVPDSNMMYGILDALGQYNDEAAFHALQRGLILQSVDFGRDTPRQDLDNFPFDDLHFAAANALCRSPYPGAFPYLVSKRKELNGKARNSIAIALATKLDSAEAISILKELTDDPDDGVRLDAGISLASRMKQNDAGAAPVTRGR